LFEAKAGIFEQRFEFGGGALTARRHGQHHNR
jgi:hypothetical protein